MITYPNRLGFWLRKLNKMFPEVFSKMPLKTKLTFMYVRLSPGSFDVTDDLKYTYEPKLDYLSLKYKDTDGNEREYGFDLKKIFQTP